MAGLIAFVIQGLLWLTLLAVRLLKLAVHAPTRVVRLTAVLIRQDRSKTRSPDGRYWWDGQKWVPRLARANWAVPIGALAIVILIGGVCTAAALSPPTTTNTSAVESPGTGVTASADPEADPSTSPPVTTANLPLAGPTKCGDPHAHVYNPDRLQLLAPCVTVTGTVIAIRTERDGDLHVLLRLDPGQENYINATNVSAEGGDLVLEPVCVDTPTQTDAIAACAGYKNPLPIPAVGTHVSVTGAWVLDLDHGWMEIHPVSAFNAVASAPSPTIVQASPTSTPPPPTVQPAANLCGAPANPWNYNFCGGNLISSPPSDFCQYFNCISSFWNGTGYVVQCVDGRFSKSGGHSGVCSQHDGFQRNLYAP